MSDLREAILIDALARAEAAERALATLREDVAREIEAQPWSRPYEVAAEIAARIARGAR